MKKWLLILYIGLCGKYSAAQFYKGEKLLGGNIQIANSFGSPFLIVFTD